jgi:hypothetical protein
MLNVLTKGHKPPRVAKVMVFAIGQRAAGLLNAVQVAVQVCSLGPFRALVLDQAESVLDLLLPMSNHATKRPGANGMRQTGDSVVMDVVGAQRHVRSRAQVARIAIAQKTGQ